ncbi:MAG TPA: DUF2835 family protein [Gammaproteobacteria bacterium]|nr:DUF2835 family protein [Gammaproteobacteria bacterium]
MSNEKNVQYFDLDISRDEFIYYYNGTVKNILVTTMENKKVQFPASMVQKFVDHYGVRGRFKIIYDNNNKLISINRER